MDIVGTDDDGKKQVFHFTSHRQRELYPPPPSPPQPSSYMQIADGEIKIHAMHPTQPTTQNFLQFLQNGFISFQPTYFNDASWMDS